MTKDRRSENGNGRFTTKVKRLTVILLLIGASSGAAATVGSIPMLSLFGEFREIALIAVEGDSLPALHARRSVYAELMEEEQGKIYPNKAIIRTHQLQIKKTDDKIKRLNVLKERYKRR